MEKLCEFCKSLRPIVYCKADAAHLCLFCDSKVHSANALFNRHPRTLVCESCKYHPAYLRCSDHRMFMCRGCDNSSHNVDSHHKKRVISCYIGCPSAEDLASLWGFNSKELENTTLSGMSVLDPETAGGSSGQQTKAFYKCEKPETTCYLMQQILDLKRHQSAKGSSSSSLMFSQEQNEILPSKYDGALKFEKNIDRHLQQWLGIGTDIQDGDTPQQDLNLEPFLLPFSQIDQLNPSSTVDNPLNGESFWQSKFPVQSCQLWSQNMQDLGVCEEQIFDDFNIPDVDLTFRNFEEIFGVEKDQSRVVHLDDKGMEGSCVTKDMSLDTTNHDQGIAIEGTSTTSSVCVNQSAHVDNNIFPSTLNRQSYSETSFSLSRLSAESSGTDCMNTGLSSVIVRDQHACHSLDMGSPKLESRENVVMRIKEKKKIRRYEKKVQYASWKPKVCAGKQVKGKFAIAKGYESDTAEATRSC